MAYIPLPSRSDEEFLVTQYNLIIEKHDGETPDVRCRVCNHMFKLEPIHLDDFEIKLENNPLEVYSLDRTESIIHYARIRCEYLSLCNKCRKTGSIYRL